MIVVGNHKLQGRDVRHHIRVRGGHLELTDTKMNGCKVILQSEVASVTVHSVLPGHPVHVEWAHGEQ